MGDSVLTEILTQYEKRMLPGYIDNFVKSVTFTNGGMRYDLINFRLSQAQFHATMLQRPTATPT